MHTVRSRVVLHNSSDEQRCDVDRAVMPPIHCLHDKHRCATVYRMRTSFKYRIYLTKGQGRILAQQSGGVSLGL